MTFSWIKLLALLPALAVPALGLWPDAAFSVGAGEPAAAQSAGTVRRASASLLAEDPSQARVIVKYRSASALMQRAGTVAGSAQALAAGRVRPQHAAALAAHLGLALSDGRVLGERTQALRGQGLSSSALVQRLAGHADVEWVVVDQRRSIAGVVPNDPLFAAGQTSTTPVVGQWYLRAPDDTVKSAINALGAWATTTGSAGVTVAVLDTGVRFDHPDLAGKLWPGYDFVAGSNSADGDGRDADASDPGDWSVTSDSCGAASSSWHGTQVAGLIGAASDNAIGMAGVARNVMVLPVRVLGKCGGFDSDIVAGLRWAAGLSSDPVANPHPARVINMSLGSTGSCQRVTNANGSVSDPNVLYREAIADATAAGVTVVVAAGNENGKAVNVPANCPGAVAVAAVRHVGTKVGFSSIGPEVVVAAPGGNCVNTTGACLYPLLSTTNTGTTVPGSASYSTSFSYEVGTSFSAPLVAGTVGLMLSVDPTLAPAAIKAALQASARLFPTSGALSANAVACHAPTSAAQDECYCTTTTCGAGMLDAAAAVARVAALAALPTAAISASASTLLVGNSLTLNGSTSVAKGSASIAGYQWRITDGADKASLQGATDGSSVALSGTAAGTVTVSLTVTDSLGAIGTASTTLTVAVSAAPVTPAAPATSGGGGALGLGWLIGLALAVLALWRQPARRERG